MGEQEQKALEDLYAGEVLSEAAVAAMAGIAESQVELSHLADSKANIMITVCSILLSLAVARIEQGVLVIPISVFSVFCIPALMFDCLCRGQPAILSNHFCFREKNKIPVRQQTNKKPARRRAFYLYGVP